MHLASDTWRLCWAALCSVVLACGGETSDGVQSQTPIPSGSAPSTGGSSAAAGTAATGGFAGCVNRSVVYESSYVFSSEGGHINNVPECTPTCGESLDSIQSVPAGSCDGDPTCVSMILPDSGIWHYYLCACVVQQWSCTSVSGSP
jgi:hypothetical protein